MKRLAILVLCVGLIAATADAQKVKFGAGVQGGVTISAFQDLIKDFYGIGYTFGGHLDVNIIPAFALRLGVDYHSFGADTDKLKPFIAAQAGVPAASIENLSGGSINILAVTVNGLGKIPTKSSIVPYGLFGVGIHNISLSDIKGSAGGQEGSLTADDIGFKEGTKFGLNFGLGTEFQMKAFVLYIQAGYTLVFTEDESNGGIPVVVGISFTF